MEMGSHNMQTFRSLNAINILLSKKSETKVMIPMFVDVYMIFQWGFPGGTSGKETACQCRR